MKINGRQFDVGICFTFDAHDHLTLIECRDKKRKCRLSGIEEWRVFLKLDGGVGEVATFTPQALTSVIFGCAMSEEHKNKIIGWIDEGPISPALFQAVKKEKKFGLDIVPYD